MQSCKNKLIPSIYKRKQPLCMGNDQNITGTWFSVEEKSR